MWDLGVMRFRGYPKPSTLNPKFKSKTLNRKNLGYPKPSTLNPKSKSKTLNRKNLRIRPPGGLIFSSTLHIFSSGDPEARNRKLLILNPKP